MSAPEHFDPPSAARAATAPLVSVVIPTFRRPRLVREAVRSALEQSLREIEVIVVVDGAGEGDETAAVLAALADPRLRVLRPGRHLGNAGARNAGVAAAGAPWIALLDDDDVWMPDKLARQVAAAEAASARLPVVSCRFVARGESFEAVWPRRLPRRGQPVGDYLLCRRRPATGDGVVQTSTMMAPAELFRRCPFDEGCSRFVDVDWLLRAAAVEGFGLVFADADRPLSVWRIDDRARISLEGDWREDVAWMRARRHLVSARAYGGFMLTLPSIRAARARDRRAFPSLVREAFRGGRPGWAEMAFHLGNFLFTPKLRRRLARLSGG